MKIYAFHRRERGSLCFGFAVLFASSVLAAVALIFSGEASGRSKVKGRAKQTAKEIGDIPEKRFKSQGWIN